jgi:hypothetical protein
MPQKLQGYKFPIGVQAKPKLNPNLQIMSPELARKRSEEKGKYFKWSENIRKGTPEKNLGSFKKGGKVKKTGSYKLHKGEHVMTKQKLVKEHKHLVKVLKSGKGLKKEAHKQEKELKEYDD